MKKREEEFIKQLTKLCEDIGWEGTAMMDYQTGDVPGIIIGRKEFIDKIMDHMANFEAVIRSMEVLEPKKQDEPEVKEEIKDDEGNNGPTFH